MMRAFRIGATWVGLIVVIGVMGGCSAALFLVALEWVTTQRVQQPWLIAGLPLAGFIVGGAYVRWGACVSAGTDDVIREAQVPQRRLPLRMAPMILLGTLATHLCGGSAGREGTAVQMGAALADQCSRWSQLARTYRHLMVMAGMSAGFGALFGTPFAAALFACEVVAMGGVRWSALPLCALTAWIGHGIVLMLNVPHTHFVVAAVPVLDGGGLWSLVIVGVASALLGRMFVLTQRTLALRSARWLPWLPLRLAVGGGIVALVALALGSTRHLGLSLPLIHAALAGPLPVEESLLKLVLTAITLGFGFKGGEVTPLFVMGACLGSALALWLPLPVDVMAAVGFVAVFAACANTPLACMVMAMELFGIAIGWHAALACAVAYALSGHRGIYHTQLIARRKWLP